MKTTQELKLPSRKRNTPFTPKVKKTPIAIRLVRFAFNSLGRLFPKTASEIAFKLFTTPRKRAIHQRSDDILESARIFEFLYGKHILKGYEWGGGERIVLLVHGWESRGTAMRSFVPDLIKKGFRVVTFDGPGHGDSSGKRLTLPHFSGAVRAIINYLGGVHSIITHSFGGASTVFSLANIDKNISIEKLVLIGVPSSMENIYTNFIKYIQTPKSVASGFRNIMEETVNMKLEDAHLSLQFDKIKVGQTLIVHDKDDEVVPFSEVKSVMETWENTTFLATEGFGHFQLIKSAEVIFKVAEFVDRD